MVVEIVVGLVIGILIGIVIAYKLLKATMEREVEARVTKLIAEREDEIRRSSLEASRATIKGKVAEQLAPLLPRFKYNPSDARFLGSPVDYIVFDGYSENKQPINIVFIEVKASKKASKNSRLTKTEQLVKNAVEAGNIKYEILEIEF